MRGYGGGKKMPLGGYVGLLAGFGVLAATVAALGRRRRFSVGELALYGVAGYKLTRVLTRDRVTAPLRSPFVRFKRVIHRSEVREHARGTGLRRAIGDLVTCPFCASPWIAALVLGGATLAPRPARTLAAILDTSVVSDFLNVARAKLSD
jgi:hypothetical protein